jgi:hypothetical protein
LEAQCGGGAKKGPAMDGVRRNRRREDRQNCKNKNTQNKQKRAIQGNTKANTGKPSKTKYKGKSKQKIKQMKKNIGKPKKT